MADFTISVDLNATGVAAGTRKVRSSIASMNDSFGVLKSTIASFGGNFAASAFSALSSELIQGARAIFEYSARMQQTKIAFDTLIRNSELSAKHLADLRKFAIDTPFEFESLAKMSQRLQSVGVTIDEILPLLRDLGNVAAATGDISAQRLEGITTALTQMIGKTKVSAEEMEQLAERGIPAWQILADGLGKSQAAVRKLAEDGKIASSEMVAALQKISRERFGDAMEKQSKTMMGVLSTISDTIMQTASTAFEPLFKEINSLALRFSQAVQAQGNDLQAVGGTIVEYVTEGITSGLGRALAYIFTSAAENTINHIKKFLTTGNPLTSFGESFFTGIGRALGLVDDAKPALQNLNNTISQTDQKMDDAAASAAKFRDRLAQIQKVGDEAQSEIAALGQIINSLTLQIQFFGDESQVAATKQQLLSQGISDFTSAQARSALAYAQVLDNLKKINDLQEDDKRLMEERTDKIRDLSEQLRQMKGDADFELKFPKATELDRFNRWVRDNAAGFRELHGEIEATRKSLMALAFQREIGERNDNISAFVKSIRGEIESLTAAGDGLPDFRSKLAELVRPLNLQDSLSPIEPEKFAEDVANIIGIWQTAMDKMRAAGEGLLGGKEIEEELKRRLEAINAAGFQDLQNYLARFKRAAGDKIVNIFADAKDFENADKILQLFNEIIAARQRLSKTAGEDLLGSLDDEVRQLNVELGISAELSRADAVAKLLQTDAYKNLDKATVDLITTRAREVDSLRQASAAQEEARRQYEDVFNTVRGHLDVLAEEGFGGFFKSVMRKFQSFLRDMLAEWLTSQFFKIFSKGGGFGGGQGSGGAGGGIFGSILNGIFGGGVGGGNGPGGTPNFNPGTGMNWTQFIRQFGGGGGNQSITHESVHARGGAGSGSRSGLGAIGLAGAGAGMLGQMIGGRVGGFLSNIGTGVAMGAQLGSIIPGIGTAVGAIVGGAVGFFASLFGGDPKRKRDKNEKLPQLNKGFTDALAELRQLVADVRTLRVSPDSALSRATELRNQIASGFGIQFESKKYRKQAQSLIASRTREADALIEELRKAAEVARAASERDRRILPEFAKGVYLSPAFQEFRRLNGMIPGAWTGRDTIPALLARKEMVLNPEQQENVRRNAGGRDVFKGAGIPGYAGGTFVNSAPTAAAAPVVMETGPINVTVVVEQDTDGIWRARAESDAGQKVIATVVEKKFRNDELRLRRR